MKINTLLRMKVMIHFHFGSFSLSLLSCYHEMIDLLSLLLAFVSRAGNCYVRSTTVEVKNF